MTVMLFLSGIIAPALLWIGYSYYNDRYKPEPFVLIGITYLLGFGAAFVCYKMYSLLPLVGLPEDASLIMENDRLFFLVYCLGIVGLLEELIKILPFLLVIFTLKSFDEKIDGIIYASVIALGFASFENLHYLVFLDGFELIGRAIASPLTHSIFSSIWGYSVGVAHLSGRPILKPLVKSLIFASLLHGIFDFLTTWPPLRVVSSLVILLIWIWRIRVIDKLNKEEAGKNEPEAQRFRLLYDEIKLAPGDTGDTGDTAPRDPWGKKGGKI